MMLGSASVSSIGHNGVLIEAVMSVCDRMLMYACLCVCVCVCVCLVCVCVLAYLGSLELSCLIKEFGSKGTSKIWWVRYKPKKV